jgi:hypothetical protein
MSVDEFMEIAFEIRALAEQIKHRFDLNERALERLGFNDEDVDLIFTLWERD